MKKNLQYVDHQNISDSILTRKYQPISQSNN
ncbi:hypothetical protein M086_3328, partial [Bacteroides fragilis str. S13 L11]